MIYDKERMEVYSKLLKLAKDLQDEFTHGKVKVNYKDNIYDMMLQKEIRMQKEKAQEAARIAKE